jgi:sugar lactone lactonase YvrE
LVDQNTISRQNIRGLALDKNGQLWTADFNSGVLTYFNADYTLNKRYTSVSYPRGIAWVDNSLIVANTSRKTAILRITRPDVLPKIILDGLYKQVEAIDAQTVLLSNASSVSRFDLTTNELTPLVSGFSNIEALTVGADGRFVIADLGYNRNQLAFYNQNGTLRDSFVGLFQPRALLFDAKGQLLISNDSPRGISRVRTDGHLELFSSLSTIESMWLEENGQITVSDGSYIRELSNTGEQLTSYSVPSAKGLYRSNEGDLWVASQHQKSLFKMAADGSYQKIASGLSLPYDIEVDLAGNIHIADRSQKAVIRVSEDNALSLVATDLPQIEAITFTPDGSLFVAYESNQLVSFDANGERTELPLTTDIMPHPITGLISDSKGVLYPVSDKSGTERIGKIQTQMAQPDIQPGEVVYTATADIPALSLEGEAIPVDFGAWIPTLSGDFEIEVTASAPTTTAQLNNTLHVGPSANGTLSLAQSQVFPGDRNVTAYLSLKGADSTSITQINAQGTTLAASSKTSGYGLAADNQGNIYSVDKTRKRIVQITPDGTVSDFVTNLTIGEGLAIDAQDNIYAIRANEILKITPPSADMTTPQVTTFATLSGNAEAVAIGYNNQVYTVDSSNRLSLIAADGSVKTLTTFGLNTPKALTIDAFGNFYVLNKKNGSNDPIIKITPDGKSSSVYFDQANFEFEGVNVTADCSNNLLFAPFGTFAPWDKYIGEETTLVQLIGDTGEVREVLYGPSIDRLMLDMDVLFYDRFGQRILIWTEYGQGKIFSFPVICGGIDVDIHIKTRSDVDLASSDPGPTSLIDLGDGTQKAIWNLTQVDNQGQKVQLNLQFKDLVEGETRPAVQEAFLVFHNSFDQDNPVQVPVTIPELLATRQMHIVPMLTDERYGPETPVEIQVEVLNNSDTHFNGILELTIADSNNQPVAQLPPIAVTDLIGPASQFTTSQWNTGTTYPGNYKLVSRLIDPVRTYDEAELAFEIFAPDAASQLSLRTTTDKSNYQTTDVVLINNLVENSASNRLMDDALVTMTVTDPKGQIVHTDSQPLGLLAPHAVRELKMPYPLPEQANIGTYAVQITIADSDTQLASQQTSFTVTEQIDLALSGLVEVQLARLTTNQTQTCTETITHQGTQAINDLALQQVLLDLDTLAQIDVQTTTVDLVAGAQQTLTRTFEALKPSHYACVLQMQQEQDWKTLDFKTFTVTGTLSSECSTVYAIHDQDVSDTQIFTYELNTNVIRPLGPLYPGRDLEGLDLHPYTHQLYASSGKKRAHLYHVDGDLGELNLIGDIGFSHVHALSFHPDGSLWGWSKEGLIRIDIDTAQSQLVYADNKDIEGLAWNQNGTLLYGTLYHRPQRRSTLWVYDGQSLTKSCTNLPGEVESLEIRPDGKLLFGVHEQQDMNFHVYDVETCQILVEAQISTAYHDIEAIAWPNNLCTANQNALTAFLTALSDDNVFIGEDRNLRITLEGQTHRGQLAEELTSGPAPIGNNLYLKALPDANDDGIDDFRIIYPNGDEQILYDLGTE